MGSFKGGIAVSLTKTTPGMCNSKYAERKQQNPMRSNSNLSGQDSRLGLQKTNITSPREGSGTEVFECHGYNTTEKLR
jgi:hypothetical protein